MAERVRNSNENRLVKRNGDGKNLPQADHFPGNSDPSGILPGHSYAVTRMGIST